ncbi:MAG: CNNM domain-containing protein [Acetobacteraceae bacterium]|nr:CNNM domain-containing protein [Acetobacteraceae bacterium]
MDLLLLGAILALLVASALFSGMETAFTAASRAFLARRAREGDRAAARLAALREKKDRLVAALLIGNNFVNTTATALASGLLIAWFGDGGVLYASILMTVVLVLLSEVLPKTYALQNPDAVALRASPLLGLVFRVFGPVAAAANAAVRAMLALVGVRLPEGERGATEEELLGAIDLHGEGEAGPAEAAAREERRMLRGVLALDDLTAADVMTHRSRIRALDADWTPEQIAAALAESRYSRMPLWRRGGEEVLGVLDARAVLRALRAAGGRLEAAELAAHAAPPVFVPESRPLNELLQEFRRSGRHLAFVVDEYGTLLGLVTLEDVVEVVVGPIADRGEEAMPEPAPDGSVEVRGHMRVRDLNREYEWRLPEGGASTLGGLVIECARTVPPVGAEIAIGEYRLKVLERRGLRLDRILVRREPEEGKPE